MSKLAARQKIRRGIILAMFLVFPLLYNFFSPYLIVDAAAQGIASGSMIIFTAMFFSSLILGRAFCGWVCPAGGLQAACAMAQPKPASNRANWVKWLIWVPWLGAIILLAIAAGGIRQVSLLHKQDLASPTDAIRWFVMYLFVAATIFTLAMAAGRRAFCHYGCWMAPFMIIGRWLRNRVGWRSLRLASQPDQCSDCLTCSRGCPMSLDVNAMVHSANMEHSECILCGSCVDSCSRGVIRFAFSSGKAPQLKAD